MKIRDSGMPDEQTWSRLFDIELILTEMEIISEINRLAEVGCGYGTFTIPAAWRIDGTLYAFDIDKKIFSLLKGSFIIKPYHFGLIISKN